GAQGWLWWLRGGENQTELRIERAPARVLGAVALFVVAGTAALEEGLRAMNDAAPWLDAFTTVLSLAAQYLLNRKAIENWYVWMAADVVYVYLYWRREL